MAKNKKNRGNREFKSDVFSMLMEDKSYALEVFNVLNQSEYTDPEEIVIIKSDHGISLSIRNDASFMIDGNVSYYEHQSTYSINMPLRCLIYYANDIEKYVDFNEKDLYGTREIALPTPHFVVFYNGIGKRPEIETMKLSTSFCHETANPELEVICTAYNINPDYNKELKEKSRVLYGYTVFVEKVRRYATTREKLEEAIKRAIDECIEENILKEFFLKRRKEVEKMTTIDCRFETREKLIKRDAYEDGFEDGFENGVKSELINTEREKKRADIEKVRADVAEQEVEKLKKIIKENNIKID